MLNTTLNKGIGVTPFDAMYGDKPMLPSPITSPEIRIDEGGDVKEILEEKKARTELVRTKVEENLDKTKRRRMAKKNMHKKESNVQAGEYVYLRNFVRKDSLDPMFLGPYLVTRRRGPNVTIQHPSRGAIVTHLNNCKSVQQPNVITLPTMIEENETNGNDDRMNEHDTTVQPEWGVGGSPQQALDHEQEGIAAHETTADYTMELPIAIRKQPRNKQKALGDDYVSR